jgi:enoyl-CoA hydratase
MIPEFSELTLEQPQAEIWLLTINRPNALNALNIEVLQSLSQALNWLQQKAKIKVLLITGAGDKAFVAGADIQAMVSMTAMQARNFSSLGSDLMQRIEDFPVPVIALVNGYCLGGGCELAMSCDYILASHNAVFGQPEVSLGIPPGFGATQRLSRRVGKANAMQLILVAEPINAQEALRINLCNQLVNQEELINLGLEHAAKISKNSAQAVSFAKELINKGSHMDSQHGCHMETQLFALSFATQDQTEGMSAFIERRPAQFTTN